MFSCFMCSNVYQFYQSIDLQVCTMYNVHVGAAHINTN